MISKERLNFWLANDLNVLFSGRHGVGKSSIITDIMERADLNWKYFSAATMDPWVDFIGIPREKTDGDESYLELVRPRGFAGDEVEAIVIDEFNRSHKKVRNAVMELIQFKSINGHRFHNLRVIWAIINPADDQDFSYDVQPLDPAQRDRFQVHVEIPYKLNRPYFADKYSPRTAAAAAEWWNSLPTGTRHQVSPRRLDYALELKQLGGSLRDALPPQSNPRSLLDRLDIGAVEVQLQSLFQKGSEEEIRAFFEVENQYRSAIERVINHRDYLTRFLPYLPEEKLATLLVDSPPVRKQSILAAEDHENVAEVIDDILHTGTCDPRTRVELWERLNAIEFGHTFIYEGEKIAFLDFAPVCAMTTEEFNDDGFDESPKELLELMSNRHNSSTRDRRLALNTLINKCPAPTGLSDTELVTSLEVVNTFLNRSTPKTVDKFARRHDLADFVNALIMEVAQRDSLDVGDVLAAHMDQVMTFDHGLFGLYTVTAEARR